MHDVTLVYTEYNHRLEVWVLGKRAANTTADRQQYTNTSKVCDDTMSMANSQFLEKNPNVYQHEISIITEGTDEAFPLIAVTNLDFAKTLHIGKGEIVGFARPEADEVTYIATAKELNIDPYIDNSPRNWIPPRIAANLFCSYVNRLGLTHSTKC